LYAIVNDTIIVLHGGLFHSSEVTLEDLLQIDRAAFSLQDIPTGNDDDNDNDDIDRDDYWYYYCY